MRQACFDRAAVVADESKIGAKVVSDGRYVTFRWAGPPPARNELK